MPHKILLATFHAFESVITLSGASTMFSFMRAFICDVANCQDVTQRPPGTSCSPSNDTAKPDIHKQTPLRAFHVWAGP